MNVKEIVPELNLWISKTLYNNDTNYAYTNYPTEVSEYWRCRDSVLEIIFNETADPTGTVYEDGYHFIYKYTTINKSRIVHVDPGLWPRIQIYKNVMRVYAAKHDKFNDVSNLVEPEETPIYDLGEEGYPYPPGTKPSKYVTQYRSEIITTGTDQIHRELPDGPPVPPPEEPCPTVYNKGENVFMLTEEELKMCEYLYLYRTEQFELIEPFTNDFYYTLQSPLSKWIYVYLQCYLFNVINYEFLHTITKETDGVLRIYAEKHFSDRVYAYIQKHFFSIWNRVDDIGGKEVREFVDYTQPSLTVVYKQRITQAQIDLKNIVIDVSKEDQPGDNYCFEFIYDGVKLKQGVHYSIKNISNLSNPQIVVQLLDKEFAPDTKYQMMWNYLCLTSPDSRKESFSDGK